MALVAAPSGRVTRRVVAVCGTGSATPEVAAIAERVGELLAGLGAVVITGGRGGVMEAASRGAVLAGGVTVGLLPGDDPQAANDWVQVALATGLGFHRNSVLVQSAAAVIAIGGAGGTASEVATALNFSKPVAALGTWALLRPDGTLDDRGHVAVSPEEAVAWVWEQLDAAAVVAPTVA